MLGTDVLANGCFPRKRATVSGDLRPELGKRLTWQSEFHELLFYWISVETI